MKKCVYIFIGVILLSITLLFILYCNKKDSGDMNNIFYDNYLMDDLKKLESDLTREYDLDELRAFFKGGNANESIGFNSNTPMLAFSKVNYRYPVEILRTRGYSVYRVSQGGYFYVFWIKPFVTDTNQQSSEPSVYFSAYLPSNISSTSFDSLTPGISTAEDVQRIDPSFELSFLMSRGTLSYSYLDNDRLLEIKYTYQGKIEGYRDLIVEEMRIVPRTSAPSRYSSILPNDLP